jgi:DNA-binding IclR family transcriptional regulator
VLDTLTGRAPDRATSTVAGFAQLPETTARRHLQDLTAIGVVEHIGDFPERWRLSEWVADLWQRLDLPAGDRG